MREGLLVTLGRGDTGTEFKSGAISYVVSVVRRVLLFSSGRMNR